jgi:hypothetical protein
VVFVWHLWGLFELLQVTISLYFHMILVSKQLEINVEGGNEIEIPPLD